MQIILFGASLAGVAVSILLPGRSCSCGCLCRHGPGRRLGGQLAGLPVLLFHALGCCRPVSAGGVGGCLTCQRAGCQFVSCPGPVAGIFVVVAPGVPGATTSGALVHRVGEWDDGDGVVGVADVGGAGGGVGGDGAGVVADCGLGWGVVAAGVVGAVAGGAVDH